MIDANDLLDVESELGRIVTELEVSKDTGDVIIAVCNDFSLRKLITDEIVGRTGYTRYDIHLDEKNKNLPKILSEEKDEILDSIVFVHGIEKAEPEIYRYLNFQRDIFYKLKQRVVLWCYSGFVRNLLKYAADFWRFKGNTYEFDLKEARELPVVQYMLSKEIYYRDIDELNSRIKIFEYLLKEVKSDREKADILLKMGIFYYLKSDLDKAEEMYRKSLAINEALGRKEGVASGYGNLGNVYQIRGDLDKAEELYRKSLAIEKKLGRREGIANQCGNLGNVCLIRDDLDIAEEMYRKSLLINEDIGRKEGAASDAEEMYRKSLELFISIGSENMIKKLNFLITDLKQGGRMTSQKLLQPITVCRQCDPDMQHSRSYMDAVSAFNQRRLAGKKEQQVITVT
jgi:tetratricopeptide (TPR) repeat protein